jgi:murein tripeptide amidase MpaA
VTAGMHAREWGGCEIAIGFAADLLLAYTSNPKQDWKYGGKQFAAADIQALLAALDIVIFPLVNPDGRAYSQMNDLLESTGWRKNRNPASRTRDPLSIGVDINRNFGFLWDFETKFITDRADSSGRAVDETFHGKKAFSEPESKNVRSLLDANPTTRWFIDIHGIGQTILRSWGCDQNQSSDSSQNFRNPAWDHLRGKYRDEYGEFIPEEDEQKALALSERMAAAIFDVHRQTYDPTTPFGYGYYGGVSGAVDDYVYARQWEATTPPQNKVQSFVIEYGLEFHPPFDRMEPRIDEISAALFEFCIAVT